MSGVTVARTIKSMSAGSVLVCARSVFAACDGQVRSGGALFDHVAFADAGAVRIHSSLVSTIFSRSALVRTFGGTYPAMPVIFAAMRWDMKLLRE